MSRTVPAEAVASAAAIMDEPGRAADLLRDAVRARGPPGEAAVPFRTSLEDDVARGVVPGLVLSEGGRGIGVGVWDPPSPLGASVQIAFVAEGARGLSSYRELYAAIAARAGPIAFAPGGHAGLSDTEELSLMEGLGFARFGRSEMRLPPDAPTPVARSPPELRMRPARAHDAMALARLHERAYADHFDRYLFLTDLDPAVDASHDVAELIAGRWGEFLPWASPVAAAPDALRGAVLVVRAPYGPLIADVMVDPSARRQGLGHALLGESIRQLRDRDEPAIVLNVTEGNGAALRLYQRLGFVRSLGPSYAWYSTRRIPVSPRRD